MPRCFARAIVLAVCFAATPAIAQPKKPKEPPKEEVVQAEARFFAGQKLYDDKKYHDALTEFRASYEYVPSPNSLLYVARCYRELNQIATAYDAYAKLIVEAGTNKKYAATKKAAEVEQAEIAGRVGRVVVDMPEDVGGMRLRVGYRNLDSSMYDRELTVEAGKVVVHAEAPGHKPFDWNGSVAAGETKRVQVTLWPDKPEGSDERDREKKPSGPPTRMHPLRPYAFVSAGIGVIGLATFGIFGTMASDRFDELDRSCEGRCPESRQDEVDAGRRETTIANIGLAVGLVGLAGGVAIFLLTPNQPLAAAPSEGGATVSLRISPVPGASRVSLAGAF